MNFLPLFLLVCATAQGAVLHVPGDHDRIQTAIDASQAGDTVLVHPGIWPGSLDFGIHALTLVSSEGPEATVIDGQLSGSTILVAGGQGIESRIEGFTIRGGRGTSVFLNGVQRGGVGGGIFCRSGSSPTVRGNIIVGNLAVAPQGVGGGIFAWNSSPRIEGNRIVDNEASYGGGIYLQGSDAEVVDNWILDNRTQPGGKGGGLRAMYGSPLIAGNTFAGNLAHWIGGAIALSEAGTVGEIERNIVFDNRGQRPIDIAYSARGDLACNLIHGNSQDVWPVDGYWNDHGGNVVADPLFCGPTDGPWQLDPLSPALPGQHPQGADCGLIGAPTGICDEQTADAVEVGEPQGFVLGQPYPNPFNPAARIRLEVEATSFYDCRLYDMTGRERALVHRGLLGAGAHELTVDGGGLPSGIYLLALRSDAGLTVRKLALLR